VEKIEHYYKHAGANGYHQALFHRDKVSEIYGRAARSESGKNDEVVIRGLVEDAERMMNEMKSRETSGPQGRA
jgi:hypothetical protein